MMGNRIANLNNENRLLKASRDTVMSLLKVHEAQDPIAINHSDGSIELMKDLLAVRQDWSGRGSHTDFAGGEVPPFETGRALGHGLDGEVLKITCKRVEMVLKRILHRKYSRRS